jgi:serine/threonine protein kinase
LKPGNIVVCADGSTKVTDFGIAKIVGNANLTRTGVGMGTTAYMSPEQILGAKEVDHRADIYSLGATMFEALTGRPPFVIEGGRNTESDFLTMQAHVQSVPENPQDLVAAIPDKIANAILRALAKMASQRFSSCEEFLGAVNIGNSSCANGQKNNSRRPIEARPERSIARVDKEVRKKVSPDRLNELLEIEPARFGAFEASSHRPCDCPEQLSYHEAIAWASIHCLKLPTLSELEQMQQDSSFFEGSPKLNWFWCKSVQSDFRAYVWQYKAETQVIDRAIDDKERRYNVRCVQERI